MNNNKFFAFLTALCCGASMMVMPASAEDETLPVHEYIVIGVDDIGEPKDVIILEYGTDRQLYLTQEQIELYLAEGDRTPRYGDKLTIKGNIVCTELAGTNHIYFEFDDPYEITNEGAISSETVEQNFVVTRSGQLQQVIKLEPLDDSGAWYRYYSDVFTNLGYSQPNGFDWSRVETGDEVTFRTYEGYPVLPVGIPTKEFIVIGVDDVENPQNYIVHYPAAVNSTTCYLTAKQVETFLNEGEPQPVYGDILEISGNLLFTSMAGTNIMMFVDEKADTITENDGKHGIAVTGNVLDLEERETYSINVSTTMPNGVGLPYEFIPETGQTKSHIYYRDAFFDNAYIQPDGIDWENIGTGDEVTFLMYNGFPVIPTAISRLGDANADGAVSIVDVVMVNRYVMGADMARTTMNTDAADFDENGEVTHEDSLSILKRLVGLV